MTYRCGKCGAEHDLSGIEPTFKRPDASELWNDESQDAEPPFACALANEMPNYPSTLGLPAAMSLRKPGVRPSVVLAPSSDHPFAIEVRAGVHFERALEWRLWSIHP